MYKLYNDCNVKVVSPGVELKQTKLSEPSLGKIKYLKHLVFLKKAINDFSPDIIHAHYISSYGLLGYLSGFKPFILSAWGSDVYYFPKKSPVHRFIIKYLISKAEIVCSSSKVMAKLINKNFKRKDVVVVPFGVDVERFKPANKKPKNFIVGTIKSIEKHNNIDCLIDAAKILKEEYKKDIKFVITGKGTLLEMMQQKVRDYNLQNSIKFLGFVKHENIVDKYSSLSIFIAMSIRESFGVSILEAAACGIPSITSNVGGLVEVNLHNKTGKVIEANDPQKLADEINFLYNNDEIRNKMGSYARQRVVKEFTWKDNVNKMLEVYKTLNENVKKN